MTRMFDVTHVYFSSLITLCAHTSALLNCLAVVLCQMPQSDRLTSCDTSQLTSSVAFFGKPSLSPSQVRSLSIRLIITFILLHCNYWFTCLFLTLTLKLWKAEILSCLLSCSPCLAQYLAFDRHPIKCLLLNMSNVMKEI